MLKPMHQISTHLKKLTTHFTSFSTLKPSWRIDPQLEKAIDSERHYNLCRKLIKDVTSEPNQVVPIHYLDTRRQKFISSVKTQDFLDQNPGLFDTYLDRTDPETELVPFLRASHRLKRVLHEEKRIQIENEGFLVQKLCKLLMMSKDNAIRAEKLEDMKREFGFPDDFMSSLVPKYNKYFRLVESSGEEKSFLELVTWNDEFAKSVIEKRAEEEECLPKFNWELPNGFFIKKEMKEWVKDWMEIPYVSPYCDVSDLEQTSPEMEKRTVGVLHEMMCLSLLKRMPVPVMGKVREEYRFSNSFSNTFTRHPGIFYLSMKGGIKTAVLREAYQDGELIDRDPLLVIKDNFLELLEQGHKEKAKEFRSKKGGVLNEMEV